MKVRSLSVLGDHYLNRYSFQIQYMRCWWFTEQLAVYMSGCVWRDLRLVAVHFALRPKVSSKLYPKEFECPLATEDASRLLHNFCFAKSNQIQAILFPVSACPIWFKWNITSHTWLTLGWSKNVSKRQSHQRTSIWWWRGVDWEEHRKELKKLVLKQIPSWSLSVLSVPL